MKDNEDACSSLIDQIRMLMDLIYRALTRDDTSTGNPDIAADLKSDAEKLQKCVQNFR